MLLYQAVSCGHLESHARECRQTDPSEKTLLLLSDRLGKLLLQINGFRDS